MDIVTTLYGRQERSWQIQANCMGVDPDLFFPERGASTREAKEVCRGCVVREDCLEYALANGEKFGIWGGMSERERRRVRRARALQRRDTGSQRLLARPPACRPALDRRRPLRARVGPSASARYSSRIDRGISPTSSAPMTAPPSCVDQVRHQVIDLGRAEVARFDQVARDLGPIAHGQAEGAHHGAAEARGHPLRHRQRGDPDVVGHQDRPGSDGGGTGGAMRVRGAEIRGDAP